MEKVPQIVSERLKAMAATAEHPNADLLTAFAERSLFETERARVLEHLAHCSECREIVALALPASEPVQQVQRPTSPRRLSWPVLRWGLVAAGMVAIVSFGVVLYQRHAPSTMAYVTQREAPAKKKAENLPVPVPNAQSTAEQDKVKAPPASAPAESRDVESTTASTPSLAVSSSAHTHPVTHGSGGAAGPRVQWQQSLNQQNTNNLQLQNLPAAPPAIAKQMPTGGMTRTAPVPAPSQPQDVSSAYSAQAGAQSNLDTPVLESQRIDEQPSIRGRAEAKVERVKPAGTSIVTPSKVIAADMEPPSPPAGARILTAAPGSPTRWTINSAGGLQRSFDQGSTWQDVDVRNSGAPAAASGLAVVKNPSRTNEVIYDSLAKKDASPVVFRAVAANGPDVWAGAAGGFLYHTSDAGAHWTRVVPSASGVNLSGDILSLEFIDAQHGRITTSTPEIWTTSDAGQSWQKQ